MSAPTEARLDLQLPASAPAPAPPAAFLAGQIDQQTRALDLSTRALVRLLVTDLAQHAVGAAARVAIEVREHDVRVELRGKVTATRLELELVSQQADRWGLHLGRAGGDLVWFEIVR